jgi:hypothetical protein
MNEFFQEFLAFWLTSLSQWRISALWPHSCAQIHAVPCVGTFTSVPRVVLDALLWEDIHFQCLYPRSNPGCAVHNVSEWHSSSIYTLSTPGTRKFGQCHNDWPCSTTRSKYISLQMFAWNKGLNLLSNVSPRYSYENCVHQPAKSKSLNCAEEF